MFRQFATRNIVGSRFIMLRQVLWIAFARLLAVTSLFLAAPLVARDFIGMHKYDWDDSQDKIPFAGLLWDHETVSLTWTEATKNCSEKGMRLPTRDELVAVYDSGIVNLLKPKGEYWASRLVVGSGDYGSLVNLNTGERGSDFATESHYCRCVSGNIKSTDPDNMQVTIITYYNMVRHDEEQLKVVDGKWKAFIRDEPVDMAVVDIENGYLEFVDEGTGGGGTTFTVALFLTKDKGPMLAEVQESRTTGYCPEPGNELKTYRLREHKMIEVNDVLAPIPLELFFVKGYDPKKSAPSVRQGRDYRIAYRLPRKGTTLEAFLDASALACSISRSGGEILNNELEEKKEFLRNVLKDSLKLKWKRATGRFDLPTEK